MSSIIGRLSGFKRVKFSSGDNYLKDFDKDLNKNIKIVKSYMEIILKDMTNLGYYEDITRFDKEIEQQAEDNQYTIMQFLTSEEHRNCDIYKHFPEVYEEEADRLAVALSQLVMFERYYALYFMYVKESRTDLEKDKVIARLVLLYDTLKYVLTKNMLYGRGEFITWDDKGIEFQKNSKISDLIYKVNDHTKILVSFIKAIRAEDSAQVFKISEELRKPNLFVEAEEIFEL